MGASFASMSSYLYGCGVLDVVYFLQGSTTTSSEINEIGSTLSFYIDQPIPSLGAERAN